MRALILIAIIWLGVDICTRLDQIIALLSATT